MNLKEVTNYVASTSWFVLEDMDDDDEDNELLFATRDNGDVGLEVAGYYDIKKAKELAYTLNKATNIEASVEEVDEFVHLLVNIK